MPIALHLCLLALPIPSANGENITSYGTLNVSMAVKQPPQIPRDPEEGLYCIANRADNMLHVGLSLTSTCGSFAKRTGYSHSELSCDKYGTANCRKDDGTEPDEDGPFCPPPACDNKWGRADWVFSTYYNLVGHCDQYHGAKINAAMLVTLDNYTAYIPDTPVLECVIGFGRGMRRNQGRRQRRRV
mmetsp:Transcript_15565/g.52562  ORF Transcript_15565/g.52562 Transcript_15565/m.52562 type:complete len:186 (+) Transcript_15565:77-634(+)